MTQKDPHTIVYRRHVTEKALVLQGLHKAKGPRSLQRCDEPKYVFIVHPKATKIEIAKAVEQIYSDKAIKVVKVNTIQVKSKPTRSTRFRTKGRKSAFKKAIVTLRNTDQLDEI